VQRVDSHEAKGGVGDCEQASTGFTDEAQGLHPGARLHGIVQVHPEEANGWAQLPEDMPEERLLAAVCRAFRAGLVVASRLLYL
jgi:hypothetical protein